MKEKRKNNENILIYIYIYNIYIFNKITKKLIYLLDNFIEI